MDSDRKREIIAAEERFRRLDKLAADLAAQGFYVVGQLTTSPPAPPASLEADSETARI